MAALNHPRFGDAAPLIRREISPSMYRRNLRKEKGIENISNRPERSGTIALDWEIKEQLQFVIKVLNARLSDQTPTSEQHGRGAACVKAHDRFAAQNTRP
jgi:hypothetical protein